MSYLIGSVFFSGLTLYLGYKLLKGSFRHNEDAFGPALGLIIATIFMFIMWPAVIGMGLLGLGLFLPVDTLSISLKNENFREAFVQTWKNRKKEMLTIFNKEYK